MQSPVGGIFVASVRHRSHRSPVGAAYLIGLRACRCHKYAAPAGPDGASGLQYVAPTGLDGASGLPVLQICRPHGAWIGASPKSVIISVISIEQYENLRVAILMAEVKQVCGYN